MRPSQNISSLPESTSPLSTTIIICDAPRIYPSHLKYTPTFFNNYIWPSQNLPFPPRIYPPFQQLFYFATLPEHIPPSQNIPPFQQLYATLPDTTPPSENPPPVFEKYMPHSLWEYIPPQLSTTICDIPRIYTLVTEYAPFSSHYM